MGLAIRRAAIVLFGDSLTQRSFELGGWGARLADRYCRQADVFCRGYGSYTTRWCRAMLGDMFPPAEELILVLVLLGTNDSALEDLAPTQYVPLTEYAENLSAIINRLRRRSKFVVIVTPPCLHEGRRIAHQQSSYQNEASGFLERTDSSLSKYAVVAKEVANYRDVPCFDIFRQTSIASVCEGRDLFVDGVHFHKGGQEYFFQRIIASFQIQGIELSRIVSQPDWPFGFNMKMDKETWKKVFRDHYCHNFVPSLNTASEDVIYVGKRFIFWTFTTLLCLVLCFSNRKLSARSSLMFCDHKYETDCAI